jgi:hypothetical protein
VRQKAALSGIRRSVEQEPAPVPLSALKLARLFQKSAEGSAKLATDRTPGEEKRLQSKPQLW